MKNTLKKPTTIRLDDQTKKWAQTFARQSGIDLSTLITLSLRETQKKGAVTVEPVMSPAKLKYYEDMVRDIDAGKIPVKRYESLEAMKKDLLK